MENNHKYRYSILNQDAYYYWDRRNGISIYRGKQKVIGHCLLNFKLGEYTDIPIDTINYSSSLTKAMSQNLSMCIFPYEVMWYGRTSAVSSYKAGIEKSMYFIRSGTIPDLNGRLVEINPQVKVGNEKQVCAPFYVRPGMIIDHTGKMLLGTFIRVRKVNFGKYELQNCVVKVAEEVFIEQTSPLHKIILKDILPDIMGSAYKFPIRSTIWEAASEENTYVWLDVIMEVNKSDVPVTPITPLYSGFSDADVCKDALKLIHMEEEL